MRSTHFLAVFIFFHLLEVQCFVNSQQKGFLYNDLGNAFLSRDGAAQVADNGLLQLTDHRDKYQTGHAFYSRPFQLNGNVSFSTTFVVAIASEFGANGLSGQGMAFVITPQRRIPGALPNQYLGLFNESSNGQSANHLLAVELDTVYNIEFDTIQEPHVGIDINSLKSLNSTVPAYPVDGKSEKINLNSGEPVQVWVNYDWIDKLLTVSLAPLHASKPDVPLLSLSKDLSTVFLDSMYVGFSASTQSIPTYHYVLGWSFQIDGEAPALNLASLPKLPQPAPPPKKKSKLVIILPATLGPIFVLALVAIIWYLCKKCRTPPPQFITRT
ncbi:hypothetical protein C5167_011647 [Papaver somniferum]|uniref:Legume lectin domain-containing protein n=1 Tax=Papaver somniferum TaxID=3469 RepID=A0A4Y7K7I5_PAPSO|nr:L-type lectin-domain containing receptor kinase I.3-like [Papaver somniferum]RZC67965.1 hypothetical protein C5167_011647 [Papaver somniferum]